MSFLDYTGLQRLVTKIKGLISPVENRVAQMERSGLVGDAIILSGGNTHINPELGSFFILRDYNITLTIGPSPRQFYCIFVSLIDGTHFNSITWPDNIWWDAEVLGWNRDAPIVLMLITPYGGDPWFGHLLIRELIT